ncbi:MAG: prepilin peptidase [Myxococcales bacterium]|nr:MAG: prepilin peptidase [Myxococcales bacterium]
MSAATVEIIVLVFVFLFGASIGSFLNVVIFRLPEGKSLVRPPSHCPACGHGIRWYDNIPILSYVLLGGKCRSCRASISLQYPMIELLTAALAIACYQRFGLDASLPLYFAFCAALVAITFIDIPRQIIPDEISLPGVAVGVAASFVAGEVRWTDSVIGAAVGFALIALIAYGYYFLTHREGMGMGDAKLLAMIAAFLGWQSIPFVLFAASVQGLALALFAIGMGWMKKAPPLPDPREAAAPPGEAGDVPLRQAAVPFGPFLSLAALEWLFFGPWLMSHLFLGGYAAL